MIRSAVLAVTLAAFVAGHAPPVFAQDAATEEPAAHKRTRASRKREAPKPDAQDAAADETPAKGSRAARKAAPGGKPAKAATEAKAPPGLKASPVGTFGEWSVFAAGEGKARICYAISQPQKRLPASLKRDPAYLFVTVRKAEKVPNEVALMMGFAPKAPASQTASAGGATPTSAGSEPTLTIGAAKYTLVIKETNAWLQNPADETRAVAEMARGKQVVVKATSLRGNASTDEYLLTGFGDAIKRAREECK